MDMLCDVYRSPEGDNLCKTLTQDIKCIIDESMTLHESLAHALWSPENCPVGKEMQHKLCECSCWSRIVQVYTPMFLQWSKYDDQVAAKSAVLQTMCKKDVIIQVESYFKESTTTQCGFNTIKMFLTPSKILPIGSVITVQGLNGEPINGSVILEMDSSSALSGLSWTAAECSEWCSKSGFCPEKGSARDNSCMARPTEAEGLVVTGQRCMRWCDSDALITVTVNETYAGQLVLAVKLLNPCFQQIPNALLLSITGPGVYAPKNRIMPEDEVNDAHGVLSAKMPPAFLTVDIGESGCDGILDEDTNKWRGSCAGMINTIIITIQPNLEIYSGANLMITGLVRSGDRAWAPPTIRTGAEWFSNIAIDDWKSEEGAVTLRMLEGDSGANVAVIDAKMLALIALEFPMPSIVDSQDAVNQKPPIKFSVSRAGSTRDGFFSEKVLTKKILAAKQPSQESFKTRSIASSTCFPGECNQLTVTILSNRVFSDKDDVTISITGFAGMDVSEACNPRAKCAIAAPNDIELFDSTDGSNHRNLFRSLSNNTAHATWDVTNGRVTVRLAKGVQIEAYKEYSISFKFQNGFVGMDLSSQLKVAAVFLNGDCLAGLTNQADGTCDGTSEIMAQKSPVQVCAPAFMKKNIGQSFPWPDCDGPKNLVTVTLQPNVRIDVGSRITLKNFFGPKDYTKDSPTCKTGCSGAAFYPRGECSVSERNGNCTCSSTGDATCLISHPCNNATTNCSNTTTTTCQCMIRAVEMLEAQSHNVTFEWNDEISQIDLQIKTDDALLPGTDRKSVV